MYYKTEIRKVGLYENDGEKEEYLDSLDKKAEREYRGNPLFIFQLLFGK